MKTRITGSLTVFIPKNNLHPDSITAVGVLFLQHKLCSCDKIHFALVVELYEVG